LLILLAPVVDFSPVTADLSTLSERESVTNLLDKNTF